MYKGPGTRTSRTQAEDIGTESSGFVGREMSDDEARAGYMATPKMPSPSKLPDTTTGPYVQAGTKPLDPSTPFKLGQ